MASYLIVVVKKISCDFSNKDDAFLKDLSTFSPLWFCGCITFEGKNEVQWENSPDYKMLRVNTQYKANYQILLLTFYYSVESHFQNEFFYYTQKFAAYTA